MNFSRWLLLPKHTGSSAELATVDDKLCMATRKYAWCWRKHIRGSPHVGSMNAVVNAHVGNMNDVVNAHVGNMNDVVNAEQVCQNWGSNIFERFSHQNSWRSLSIIHTQAALTITKLAPKSACLAWGLLPASSASEGKHEDVEEKEPQTS